MGNKASKRLQGIAPGGKGFCKGRQDNGYPTPPEPKDEVVPNRYYKRNRRGSVSSEAVDPNNVEIVSHYKDPQEHAVVMDMLRNSDNFLFRNLDEFRTQQIADAMFKTEVNAGETIIKQGERGDNFYLIGSGEVEVFVLRDQHEDAVLDDLGGKVLVMGPGQSFGELALMYMCPRAASCVASQPTSLWTLGREEFRALVVCQESMKYSRWESFIDGVEIFASMNQWERRSLSEAIEEYSSFCHQSKRMSRMPNSFVKATLEMICSYFRREVAMHGCRMLVMVPVCWSSNIRIPGNISENSAYCTLLPLNIKRSDMPRAASIVAGEGGCVVLRIPRAVFDRLCGPITDILLRNQSEYIKYEAALANPNTYRVV